MLAFVVSFGGGNFLLKERAKQVKEERAVARSAAEKIKLVKDAGLGGNWELTRLDGTRGGSEDLKGNFGLIYFGFTHCPDICPEEIEKAVKVVDAIDDDERLTKKLIPVFITLDPDRDTPTVLSNYIKEFSPKMIGYTGTPEEIKKTSKQFGVYFGKGPADEDGDYIIDHSIIMYLTGPDGIFLDYYGQNRRYRDMTDSIASKMMKEQYGEKKEGFWARMYRLKFSEATGTGTATATGN